MARLEWDSIEAIRDYMNRYEGELRKTPKGTRLITDFRKWYSNLNIIDETISTSKRLAEAKWYRNQANGILKMQLPPDWKPVDVEAATGVGHVEPAESDPTPKDPLIPTWAKVAGGVVLGLFVWSLWSGITEEEEE